MTESYKRKLSGCERLWLAGGRLCPVFANQIILEGTGTLDKSLWEDAVKKASEANPGSRLILKGHLGWSRWVDNGSTPPVREVDGRKWSGYSNEGAPFLQEPLPPRTGPTSEVLIIRGDPPRLAFRTHHAVMDGRGTQTWVEDIFRALRGETLVGSNSRLTDIDFMRNIHEERLKSGPGEKLEPERLNCIAPTGKADGLEFDGQWARKTIRGKYSKLLPQIAVLVAREARKIEEGKVQLRISVDMRPQMGNLLSTGNLTDSIDIVIPPGATPEQVEQDFHKKLDEPDISRIRAFIKLGTMIKLVPVSIVASQAMRGMKKSYLKNRFLYSGVISNVGRPPLDDFTGGGFQATTCFFIPPYPAFYPFFMTITGFDNRLELVLTTTKGLASNGRIDTILENIVSGLVPKKG